MATASRSLDGPGLTLRAIWWLVAIPLAAFGAIVGCLWLGVGALLLVGAVTAFVAYVEWGLCCQVAGPRGATQFVPIGLTIGMALLCATGIVGVFGIAGWLVCLLIGVSGWLLLGGPGVTFSASSTPRPLETPGQSGAPPVEELAPAPLPEPATLSSLTTAELCWEWRVCYVRLSRDAFGTDLDRLSHLRAGYLDELRRRDPAAYQQWFPVSPRGW